MTTTIIILLSAAVLLLVMLMAALIWRVFRQSDDIKQKNDVIVREVRRNQLLIHKDSFREPSKRAGARGDSPLGLA